MKIELIQVQDGVTKLRYCIAGNARLAASTMQHDRKWKRLGPDLYLDDEGQEVKVLSGERHSMAGIRPDKLYLGYGYYSRRDRGQLGEFFEYLRSAYNFEIVDLTLLKRVN